jgi:hypothetical protein
MQTFGGLMLGLGVINLVRLAGLSADLRIHLLEVLVSMALYGGGMMWLGWRLGRGRPNGREAALIGGGLATALLFVLEFVFYTGPRTCCCSPPSTFLRSGSMRRCPTGCASLRLLDCS